MHSAAVKVFAFYGAWSLLLLAITLVGSTFSGHGEYGITAHFLLVATGLPLSLLSLHVLPNGGTLAVLVAGLIGTAQWMVVAEANFRWERWRQSHPRRRSPITLSRAKLRTVWVTAFAAPIAAGFALLSTVSYAWLNASGAWSAEHASLWAGVAFAFFCLFGVVTVLCVALLLRHYNSLPHLPSQ